MAADCLPSIDADADRLVAHKSTSALVILLEAARALGEYGATLMVGGDINGRTRTMSLRCDHDHRRVGATMPIALYEAVFYGSHQRAMTLALVQLGVTFVILFGVGRLGKVRPW